MAGASSSKKFEECPVNAPVVDYAQTKGDGIELWAIRLPPGFDPSRLDGLTLDSLGASGDGFTVREAPSVETASMLAAFPSAKKNRWMLGKPFARQLVVRVPPPATHASAEVPPPPLPRPPQVRSMRLCRPYKVPEMCAPPAAAAASSSPPASTRKRAEAPASKAGKAGKADKRARTKR